MINYLQLQPAAGGLICPYRAEAVSLSAKTPYLIGDVTFAYTLGYTLALKIAITNTIAPNVDY